MQIKIIRKRTNRLYTEGELEINGKHYADTIEATETMAETGVYIVTKQIYDHIGHGNSWLESLKTRKVLIGEYLIPGIIVRSRQLYDRLLERVKKQKHPISLIITDDQCHPVAPTSHWESVTRNSKLTLIFVFTLLLLTACSTSRHVVVREASHDTLYINTLKHDSIYLYQGLETDRTNDTVVIREISREFKYQFLHDTMRIVKNDTIPVVHTVEKPVKYIPAIYKWSLGICIIFIIIALAVIAIRVISAIRVRL